MKIIKIFTILLISRISNSQPATKAQWTEFKIQYNKQYSSIEEDQKRFLIYNENYAKIAAHNERYDRGEVTYYQKMNKFGDLTTKEFLYFVNRTRPTTFPQHLTQHQMSMTPLDVEVDWRTKNVLTEVKNEGDCGSSWSFSAIGAVESQLAIKTGQLKSLSEQNLIDCSGDFGNQGCDGGLINSAFDYIKANGIMSESDYPYEGKNGACKYDQSKTVTKISSYVAVDFMSENGLADAVANKGPVTGAIDATDSFRFYYGGIFFDDHCNVNLSDLNHGVLIVGYGRELQYDYWIVKNSWGTEWGENGYYKAIRNYGNNCGIATQCSYPQI